MSKIRIVNDFPTPGIKFYDITTLMNNGVEYKKVFDQLLAVAKEINPEVVVALEARGYFFGPALALALNIPFAPIRKKGKLPYHTYQESFDLEYGDATIEIHTDAMGKNRKVLIFDDVLATGGTAEAAIKLVNHFSPTSISCLFLMELSSLKGRDKLSNVDVKCLATV